ncbi:MAG: hypothetical protein HRU70_09115 [Phycisphaeraceae bacterium]|nr:MAG: hypothetical protein HRU70_09115 [Phycisphaeraceae bacterium]
MGRGVSGSRRLVVLNVALLALLAGLTVWPGGEAGAQPVSQRPRGEYTMVSAKTVMGSNHAVYIIDASNREMVAVRWDARRTLAGIGYRNLDADIGAPAAR